MRLSPDVFVLIEVVAIARDPEREDQRLYELTDLIACSHVSEVRGRTALRAIFVKAPSEQEEAAVDVALRKSSGRAYHAYEHKPTDPQLIMCVNVVDRILERARAVLDMDLSGEKKAEEIVGVIRTMRQVLLD